MSDTPAYDALVAHHQTQHDLEHLQALASWDRLTGMPAQAAAARARAQGALAVLLRQQQENANLKDYLLAASSEPLNDDARLNVALMQRALTLKEAVPPSLAGRFEVTRGAAAQAWGLAREDNNWTTFANAWRPLVSVVREQAERIGQHLGLSAMDALYEGVEPGLRQARLEPLIEQVTLWLPPLVARARQLQGAEPLVPTGPFATTEQQALCQDLLSRFGFDFGRGRLDACQHPFTGGVPEDVRLATRFVTTSLLPALMGVLHEAGHAGYQQHLPRNWLGQPLAGPHSASLHEAQALTFERQLASMPAFWQAMSPMLCERFGNQPAFDPINLWQLTHRVRPGLVRVQADALSYPLHIVLRHRIECALVNGDIEVEDVPVLWAEQVKQLLGLNPTENFIEGPLQDMHWVQGMFGYFPSYLLGAMAAAQLMQAVKRDTPDLEELVRSGNWHCVADWLRPRVWEQGARRDLDEALRYATGESLSEDALRRQLSAWGSFNG